MFAILASLVLAMSQAVGAPVAATGAADPVSSLSVRQLVGQRVIVGYDGTRIPGALRARIARGEVGGVIVFTRNIPSRASLRAQLRTLQAIKRPIAAPLLTMVDQEGGLVKRLDGPPSAAPARMAQKGAGSVHREGEATAANLRQVGVNVNLAPVADLGRPGSFQRETGRAFGDRAAATATLVTAFATGLQDGGVAATLKHFPGLGGVADDEDQRVQTVGFSQRRLRDQDEVPFAAAIRAGSRLVMTSTARYPALDPAGPALLSRTITTTELRARLGFRGVAITDDLDVPALASFGGPGRLGVQATQAGNDLLLYAQSGDHGAAAVDAVAAAVRTRAVSRTELEASVGRVLALRAAVANTRR